MSRGIVTALVLAGCLGVLGACSAAQRAEAATAAQRQVNAYCDARQKALVALGVDGSSAIGLGEAGASP